MHRVQARRYSFFGRPEAIVTDVVITSIIPECHRGASKLFDLGST